MSNIGLITEEGVASIGNFLVRRLLSFRQKRKVGPFAFIDHLEPATMGANTTEYLFGGEPFPELRCIDWNFVSSRRDRLRKAKED